jgi:hypothetical protein
LALAVTRSISLCSAFDAAHRFHPFRQRLARRAAGKREGVQRSVAQDPTAVSYSIQ